MFQWEWISLGKNKVNCCSCLFSLPKIKTSVGVFPFLPQQIPCTELSWRIPLRVILSSSCGSPWECASHPTKEKLRVIRMGVLLNKGLLLKDVDLNLICLVLFRDLKEGLGLHLFEHKTRIKALQVSQVCFKFKNVVYCNINRKTFVTIIQGI